MSVTITIRFGSNEFFRLPRTFLQLPEYVQPFQASGALTGDVSGGNWAMLFDFNPDALVEYQPYVAISEMSVYSTTVDPKTLYMQAPAGAWEDNSLPRVLYVVDPVETQDVRYVGIQRMTHYVGRGIAGNTNSLQVYGDNVDGAVVNITIRGWLSEMPFQAPDNLSP